MNALRCLLSKALKERPPALLVCVQQGGLKPDPGGNAHFHFRCLVSLRATFVSHAGAHTYLAVAPGLNTAASSALLCPRLGSSSAQHCAPELFRRTDADERSERGEAGLRRLASCSFRPFKREEY